jgi:hypothetical protein
MVVGDLNDLGIRVEIDETDIQRFTPEGRAIAYPRGNQMYRFELVMDHVEPLVVSRSASASGNNKANDSKILQVVYKVLNPIPSSFVGQQMDVYIESIQN